MPDRRTPLTLTGEKETLQEFLDYLRESLILKVEDLDEESAHRSTVPTGTCLLGLVKHLTVVEVVWFQFAFSGLDAPVPSEEIAPTDTVASAVASYRAAAAVNDGIVQECDDLDRRGYCLPRTSVFTFGDAKFHGSTGGVHLNAPVVGLTATGSNGGYLLPQATEASSPSVMPSSTARPWEVEHPSRRHLLLRSQSWRHVREARLEVGAAGEKVLGPLPSRCHFAALLVHMVEETARHAGHADILREQIDGITGR